MTSVFIGGSRHIRKLSPDVIPRLDRIVEGRLHILIGDASGTDRAVQAYLKGKGYDLVEVFCTGDECRNNVGSWSVRALHAMGQRRGFAFYALKDRAMAEQSSVGFMIWDGKSKGTLLNVFRMVRLGKKVAVYLAPERRFFDVKTWADWESLFSRCSPELAEELRREAQAERSATAASAQADLLF